MCFAAESLAASNKLLYASFTRSNSVIRCSCFTSKISCASRTFSCARTLANFSKFCCNCSSNLIALSCASAVFFVTLKSARTVFNSSSDWWIDSRETVSKPRNSPSNKLSFSLFWASKMETFAERSKRCKPKSSFSIFVRSEGPNSKNSLNCPCGIMMVRLKFS